MRRVCMECSMETVGKGRLDMFTSAASSSHHGDGGDSDEYEDLIIILASWWLRWGLILSVQSPVLFGYHGVYAPSSDWDWRMRSKAESLCTVSNYFNSSAPLSSLWLHLSKQGESRGSTIGVLVRQLRQGYGILCKKTSGHCKFMQYYHYFHSDTVCHT